jgi:unsaturated rhamnogalacturonyl hydrolase
VQDPTTGLWYDIVDKKSEPKNYFEASASSMLVYTLAKAVRKGYLPASMISNATKGYDGIIKRFIREENGLTNLHGTVAVSGLGGNPYRDGSFEYYMSEPVIVNDSKGMGAFINAAVEMEMVKNKAGIQKLVLLDGYYNNEWKKDVRGKMVRWHYTWDDKSNGGYSMLGAIFNRYGARTKSLQVAPTSQNLKQAAIYIIVDPDTEKETEIPHFINEKEISAISEWVKNGGVLVLFGNDAGNAEFNHFNKLASKFGIQFNEDSKNRVEGNQFEQGKVTSPWEHYIFKYSYSLYIKEYSSLQVTSPAFTVLKKDDDNVMAYASYGKGTVFAIGDPWLYNEYLDGRKLPESFDNYRAAEDLVQWLLKKTTSR